MNDTLTKSHWDTISTQFNDYNSEHWSQRNRWNHTEIGHEDGHCRKSTKKELEPRRHKPNCAPVSVEFHFSKQAKAFACTERSLARMFQKHKGVSKRRDGERSMCALMPQLCYSFAKIDVFILISTVFLWMSWFLTSYQRDTQKCEGAFLLGLECGKSETSQANPSLSAGLLALFTTFSWARASVCQRRTRLMSSSLSSDLPCKDQSGFIY